MATIHVFMIFVLGYLSGFGCGWSIRPKPIPAPSPEAVPEEVMQQFERIMSTRAAMESDQERIPDVVH
jgi:hypothetical protein